MLFLCRLFITVFVVAQISNVWASAWTLPDGVGEAIVTTTFYHADERFDEDGNRVEPEDFSKIELSPYIEYGVIDSLTVGVNPRFQYLESDLGPGKQQNAGFAGVDIFARQRLWHNDQSVFSVQFLTKVPPGIDRNDRPALDFEQFDLEGRLLFGHSGTLGDRNYFIDIEAAFRKRLDEPSDEARFDATFGYYANDKLLLMLQSFNIESLNNADTSEVVQTAGTEFDLYKLQFSVVWWAWDKVGIQFGGFHDIAGRNVGAGHGALLGLWFNF